MQKIYTTTAQAVLIEKELLPVYLRFAHWLPWA
jgi:hypothetical protein